MLGKLVHGFENGAALKRNFSNENRLAENSGKKKSFWHEIFLSQKSLSFHN